MFNFFKKNKKEPRDLREVLEILGKLVQDIKKVSQDLENFKKESKSFFRKLAVVRFNPFKEVGGDQSFSIALLDANDNGVIITSYYSREMNRVYAKPIRNGQSEYSLSEEEREVIKKAIGF